MERDPLGAERAIRRPPLPVLTTLRFFAAAEVVAFHVAQTRPGWERPVDFLSGLVSGGHAAVIFFFVLSGFILAYVHAGDGERASCDVEAPRFWRLRFARIAPAYYVALVLALPIVAQLVVPSPASNWSVAAGLASVVLFLQAWWPAYVTLWNFPAWSLSVECVFYALFPWLVRLVARCPATIVLAASYVLIVLASTWRADLLSWTGMLAQAPPDEWLVPSFFPVLFLPLFILGMAMARLFLFGPALSPRLYAAMLGVGVALLVVIFGAASMLPSWTRTNAALVPVFAFVIIGGAGATSVVPLLTLPIFLLLGEASYAIYILHIPLRYCWEIVVQTLLGMSLSPWLNFPLYFGFVVVVSVAVFRQIETPMRKWIAGRDHERSHPVAVATMAG